MKGKSFLALTLSAAMVVGSSLTVFAADQEGADEGTGEVQYVTVGDVFNVVLPTDAGTAFDYLLDPSGLIAATDGDRYTGKAFDDGKTVYFLHEAKVDGTVKGQTGTANCDYTDTSDAITAINKSTEAVDLTVTAKIAEADGVTMAATSDMSGEGENLYLALVGNDGSTNETKAITTEGVKLEASIAADDDAYEVKWVSGTGDKPGQYEKQMTTAASADGYTGFKSYTFKLTGACKANDAALLALKENPPKIDLTWSVKDFTVKDAAPSVGSEFEYDKAADLTMPVSLGSGTLVAQGVTKLQYSSTADGAYTDLAKDTKWEYANGNLIFKAGQFNSASSGDVRYLKATFDDTAATSIVIQITMK